MRFPGSRLLHSWDLAIHKLSLADLIRSCQEVGLTGLAEINFPDAVAMVFYYRGAEVNALYRRGPVGYNGEDALERMRTHVSAAPTGTVFVFELPLDVAHLLRGMTNRRRLPSVVLDPDTFAATLAQFEKNEHTGTLEFHAEEWSAMMLFVRGKISNVYFDTGLGNPINGEPARRRLEASLGRTDAHLFVAEFSQQAWRGRSEVQSTLPRLRHAPEDAGSAQLAAEENSLRIDVIEDITTHVPSFLYIGIIDLMTGSVLAQRNHGASTLQAGTLTTMVPAMALNLRRQVRNDNHDVDLVEIQTTGTSILIVFVRAADEAVVLIADRAQPTAFIRVALERSAAAYATRARKHGTTAAAQAK